MVHTLNLQTASCETLCRCGRTRTCGAPRCHEAHLPAQRGFLTEPDRFVAPSCQCRPIAAHNPRWAAVVCIARNRRPICAAAVSAVRCTGSTSVPTKAALHRLTRRGLGSRKPVYVCGIGIPARVAFRDSITSCPTTKQNSLEACRTFPAVTMEITEGSFKNNFALPRVHSAPRRDEPCRLDEVVFERSRN